MAKKPSAGEGKKEGGAAAAAPTAAPYVVLARKYRPQTFRDLIGQEAMVQTLSNAFQSGRIAHGYMLTGVRGVGKTTTARILARALNYETDTITQPTIDMPDLGRHCLEIMESRHPDVVEMDAASNTGVDNIREIIESARYKPMTARTKVFIIDEVHMLSKGAFNALLKTLEEPPGHVKFIFATTEVRKVPVTVLSRCQRFDLRRVDVPRLAQHLKFITGNEGAEADDDALTLIARAAEGSVRDALSILDQAISTSMGAAWRGHVSEGSVRGMLGLAGRGRIFDLLGELAAGHVAAALTNLEALFRDGAEAQQVLSDLAEAVHIAARVKAVGPDAAGEGLSQDEKRRAGALAAQLSMPLLSRLWQMLVKGLDDVGRAPNTMAAAEMVVIRIAYTADLPPPDDLIKALGGASVVARRPGEASAPGASSRPALSSAANDDTAPRAHEEALPAAAEERPYPIAPFPEDTFEPEISLDELEEFDQEAQDAIAPRVEPVQRPLNTFADVVALVGDKRDAKLKVTLEERVSLVKFDAAAGAIDLYLLPGAPAEIANDLREKLNKWTQRRWVVLLSRTPGEPTIGDVRRERDKAERDQIAKHPAVAAVLEAFPGAKIGEIRELPRGRRDDTASG